MRNRFGMFVGLIVLGFLLVGLNAASYVQEEKTPDSEMRPNRSTYNPGATGTQALYSLLSETGRDVLRWREPMDALKSKRDTPEVFVVVGDLRRPFDDIEVQHLLAWVNDGGRLVLIDRTPDERILAGLSDWKIVLKTNELDQIAGVDPYDQKQMTADLPAARPAQPSVYTAGVGAVQTSRFASHIEFSMNKGESIGTDTGGGPALFARGSPSTPVDLHQTSPSPSPDDEDEYEPPPPAPANRSSERTTIQGDRRQPSNSRMTIPSNAPVVHLAGGGRNILIDAKYGAGSIAILSDPYVVSNVGIGLVDNAQLAINMLTVSGGTVAFDEYHQGNGENENRFFQYFAGTPVISIFLQLAAIAGFVLYSQSRRFARAVPEPEPDRRTKLEYVAAMAELQRRTKAYDLALENIYADFRRRVCRMFGVDATLTSRKLLASMIAERIKGDAEEIETLMFTCEDIIHGEPVKGKQALQAAAGIRELETKLGLVRNGRTKVVK